MAVIKHILLHIKLLEAHIASSMVSTCECFDHPMYPAQWINLQCGIFPFQSVVYNCSIKGCGMGCPVCGKVLIKDFCCLLDIQHQVTSIEFCYNGHIFDDRQSSMIWNQCALEASLLDQHQIFKPMINTEVWCCHHWSVAGGGGSASFHSNKAMPRLSSITVWYAVFGPFPMVC